jgi:site-specific DNA-methyltransferase (cytosine-N4-specific)
VLADDGTCWLNLGDCYAANSDGWARGKAYNRRQPEARPKARLAVPPKNLLGMPWRVAFALQEDGWVLRNAIIWHKPNAMPQSVRDRLSNRYELIFLLVKQRHYQFDLDPIREPYTGDRPITRRARSGGTKPNSITTAWPPSGKYGMTGNGTAGHRHGTAMRPTGERHTACHTSGRNPGDVWSIPTRPLRAAHFAAFPIDIPLKAIAAGCRPGGKVLDPFMGSGTFGIAAWKLGRKFLGIDLNADYCGLARTQLLSGNPYSTHRFPMAELRRGLHEAADARGGASLASRRAPSAGRSCSGPEQEHCLPPRPARGVPLSGHQGRRHLPRADHRVARSDRRGQGQRTECLRLQRLTSGS